MKNYWKLVKIGDIGEVVGGGTPSTKCSDYYGGDIPWITPKDLSNFRNRYISRGERMISKLGLENSSARMLPPFSVLFTSRAPIGYIAIAKNELCTNQGFKSIIPDPKKCNALFLYYLLKYKKNDIELIANGSTFQEVSGTALKNFEVSIPPLAEQRKIAGVLSALDDKIELNNKINRNLEAQAQAIFKSWFIDFEPFKNGKFIDTELGKIPEGWKVEELGKVSKNIREKVVSRTNIPVLSAVKEGRLILSEEYFSKQVYSKSLSKYILVKENDYAYNPARVNIGSLGRNTICSLGCVSPVYIVFEIDSNYLAFFDLYFKMKSFKNEVKLRASGSVRQTLSYDDFSLIKVIYPPKSVSSKFNKLSAVFSEKITRNKKESRRLAQLRDTLLPKLMSGKIDISDVAV